MDLFSFLQAAYLSEPQPHTVERFVEFSQRRLRETVAEAEPIVLKNGMKVSVVTRPRTKEEVLAAAPRVPDAGPISFVGGASRAGVSTLAPGLGSGSEPQSMIPNADVFPRAPKG